MAFSVGSSYSVYGTHILPVGNTRPAPPSRSVLVNGQVASYGRVLRTHAACFQGIGSMADSHKPRGVRAVICACFAVWNNRRMSPKVYSWTPLRNVRLDRRCNWGACGFTDLFCRYGLPSSSIKWRDRNWQTRTRTTKW